MPASYWKIHGHPQFSSVLLHVLACFEPLHRTLQNALNSWSWFGLFSLKKVKKPKMAVYLILYHSKLCMYVGVGGGGQDPILIFYFWTPLGHFFLIPQFRVLKNTEKPRHTPSNPLFEIHFHPLYDYASRPPFPSEVFVNHLRPSFYPPPFQNNFVY